LEDWARKTSLRIVELSKKLGHAVAREDLTGLINSLRRIKNKDHRTKLIIMGYSRLGRWIDWQAEKQGIPLAIVNPNGTSSECPKCDSKIEENGYRRLRCLRCGFEADRDVIGKLNIRKRALKKLRINPPGGVLAPPGAIELLKRYNVALNYAINKILRLDLRSIGSVHNALYRELREWFGLPSRTAIDCYRDALANANAWRNNPRKGRRPRVRKLSMLLHPGSGYRIEDGYVEIIGGIKLRIIGWDRRYDGYENGEARLVYRGDEMILWISKKIPRPEPYQPRDAIAVDINERKIVYGNDRINKERDTEIDEAHRWKKLAENLQKKYSSPRYTAWRRRKGILNRIRSYHRKARNILEDWARKTSLEIVVLAKRLGYAVAREDLTGLINSLRKIKNKDHRTKLTIMGYSRLGKWID
jgi:putative transposase